MNKYEAAQSQFQEYIQRKMCAALNVNILFSEPHSKLSSNTFVCNKLQFILQAFTIVNTPRLVIPSLLENCHIEIAFSNGQSRVDKPTRQYMASKQRTKISHLGPDYCFCDSRFKSDNNQKYP